MNKWLWIIGIAAAALVGLARNFPQVETPMPRAAAGSGVEEASPARDGGQILARAFANRSSDVQVEGSGRVTRVLPDDSDGSRHQRFIVELASGQTVLVTHNIDLAPRIAAIEPGDSVSFNGEYEWNPQGGVIHWTHRDPAGRHPAGWIVHNGLRYQ